jgi:TolA-binding protein
LGHNDQALSAFANIENAPQKSPYLENILFARGTMEMASDNSSEAIALFTQYAEKYPSADSAALAMYYIGQCHENSKNHLDAFRAYSKVKEHSPSRRLYFDATLASAEAALESDSIQIGMKILESLSKDERYFSRSGEIRLKSAEGYYLQGDIDKAIELYAAVTTQNPRTPVSAEAYYRLGMIYQNDKFDLPSAKEAFGKAQGEAPESEYRNLSLARSAQIAKLESYQSQLQKADSLRRIENMESLGKSDTLTQSHLPATGDSLNSVTADTASQNSTRVPVGPDSTNSNTPERAEISGPTPNDSLLAGRADTNSVLKAPRIDTTGFSKIPFAERFQRAFSEIAAGADSQGAIIKAADTSVVFKDSIPPAIGKPQNAPSPAVNKVNEDSVRHAIMESGIETRYLLAELYAYELNRPDSALQEYLLITKEYPSSIYAAKSLLAAARIEMGRDDTVSARAYLEQVIAGYPESPQASQAAEMLNTPFDNSNNAIGLYAAAESLAISGNNADSAVALFKYIATKFPDLAPKAAYAVAWVLDDIIGVEDSSAYYAYSNVARNYGQTDYGLAASQRLEAAVKPEKKRPSPRESEPANQIQQGETPDSTSELALGLPFAPSAKATGRFIYPEALLSRDLRGKVIFKIKLDVSGRVQEHEIIGPSGEFAIDSSATVALLLTEFDVSQLDLSQLDEYYQYSISFKRPNVTIFNDPYRDQQERGPR